MIPLLKIRGLTVEMSGMHAGVCPVRDVDLDVMDGETVCLVGESGSGKSMTALAVAGLLPPGSKLRADSLSFAGHDLRRTRSAEMNRLRGRELTMIFQDPTAALDPCRTIGYQLSEVYLRHCGGGSRNALQRAGEFLERVGIPAAGERLRQYPHQLSGGLRQRVMIAMALICSPKFVIADEPTTALDVTTQIEILRLLREFKDEHRLAMLFITHDLGVVAHIADRVAVMYAGEIVEIGAMADVISAPQHPYTRALLQCVPEGTSADGHFAAIGGAVPSMSQLPPGCAFSDRCAEAHHRCTSTPIPMLQLRRDRTVRCIGPEQARRVHG
jgi:peptide/nickel transport system ATP-binding protein